MVCKKVEGCPEPEHTPEGWSAGHYKGTPTVFWDRGNGTVPIATVYDLASQGSANDNARMIAASPARTHALVKLVAELRASYHDEGELLGDVAAALAEAEKALK